MAGEFSRKPAALSWLRGKLAEGSAVGVTLGRPATKDQSGQMCISATSGSHASANPFYCSGSCVAREAGWCAGTARAPSMAGQVLTSRRGQLSPQIEAVRKVLKNWPRLSSSSSSSSSSSRSLPAGSRARARIQCKCTPSILLRLILLLLLLLFERAAAHFGRR